MQHAIDKRPAVQRGAASQRTEVDGGLAESADLEGLLPEGVSVEMALRLLTSAGLSIEEALAAYESGELDRRAADLGPQEVAALTAPTDEGAAEGGRAARPELRAACSCGGDKDEEEEDDETSGSRALSAARSISRAALELVRGRVSRPLIVADNVRRLASGQMRRSAFLARLESVVRNTAEAGLAGSGRSARDCPYIERSLRYYRTRDSRHIERAVQRYAPGAVGARSSGQYLTAIQERVETAVARWVRAGEVTGVPREVPAPLVETVSRGLTAARATRPVLRSGSDDGAVAAGNLQAIRGRLGAGRPFEGAARARMESLFGTSFSTVRIHTDTAAAALSSQLRARAFAIGEDVAFAGGRYAPGTPVGDALLAHELAHVLQQRGAGFADGSLDEPTARTLEDDADRSALSVAGSLWQQGRSGVAAARDALPRLRSGLRLSRCKDEKKATPPPTATPTPATPCVPTMKSFEAKKTGSVAMTDVWRPPTCELAFGTPSAPGITFKSEVDVPAGCTGKLEYVQLMDVCVDRRSAADGTSKRWKSSGDVLDNVDPYADKPVTSAGTVTFEADDSPGAPGTGKDLIHVKKFDFKMYLLWTPTGSPRVGLGRADWHWHATATKTGSSGTCSADWAVTGVDASGGTGTATTAVPSWTKTFPGDVPEEAGSC